MQESEDDIDDDDIDSQEEFFIYTRGTRHELIPDDLTHVRAISGLIRSNAFRNHTALKEVDLVHGLQSIEDRAFYGCISLTRISIPSSVLQIGDHAFSGCESLTEVDLPEGLQMIGEYAFYRCCQLEDLSIPTSISHIPTFAFAACSSLVSVRFQEGLAVIGGFSFCRCSSLTTISIPFSVNMIAESAFSGCSGLLNLELPEDGGNLILCKWAFKDCENLANLSIAASYYPLGNGGISSAAFAGTTLMGLFSSEDLMLAHGRKVPRNIVVVLRVLTRHKDRYEDLPVHKACSSSNGTSLTQLQEALESYNEGDTLLDCFGMTPFHSLATSANMRLDYLNALLDTYSTDLLTAKDQRGNTMIDYLLTQGPSEALPLLKMVLQRTLVDGINNWGLPQWKSSIMDKVNAFGWNGGIRGRREQFSDLHPMVLWK